MTDPEKPRIQKDCRTCDAIWCNECTLDPPLGRSHWHPRSLKDSRLNELFRLLQARDTRAPAQDAPKRDCGTEAAPFSVEEMREAVAELDDRDFARAVATAAALERATNWILAHERDAGVKVIPALRTVREALGGGK